jgi:hypothetical protein
VFQQQNDNIKVQKIFKTQDKTNEIEKLQKIGKEKTNLNLKSRKM